MSIAPHTHGPSSQGEPAPGDLELVRAFVNTRELDPDIEELPDPAALARWLQARGLEVPGAPSADDHRRAIRFREALRELLVAKTRGEAVGGDALSELRRAAGQSTIRVEIGADGSVATAPAADGVDALFAAILAAAAAAQRSGDWDRLKICPSDECLWAFYDRSRNRSRQWCSMEVCGNRAKTRAYRAKRGRPAS